MLGGTFMGSMDRETAEDCWNRSATNDPCAAHLDEGERRKRR